MEEKSLLIIHQGAFGDLVLAFPAINILKKYYSHIDGICQSQLGKLACHLDIFQKYIPLESALISSLYSDHISLKIKETINSYDNILLFSFSKHLENTLNRLRNKAIHRIPPRPPLEPEKDQQQKSQWQNIHVSDYIISSIKKCGLIKPGDSSIIKKTEKTGNHIISQTGIKILIHPGSGSKRKNWHIQNFIDLYDRLASLGSMPALIPEFIIGPADLPLLEYINKENRSKKISGVVHKPENLISLHSILKNGSIYIGNDSGVSHLAAFSGLKCIIIFGPSDPVKWSPVGPDVQIVRPGNLDCFPCFETQKKNCQTPLCLDNISIEQVLSTCAKILLHF